MNGVATDLKKSETKLSEESKEFKVSGWGYRHQQCFLLFCCFTTAFSMRACMGVSLVAMVDKGYNIIKSENSTIIKHSVNNQSILHDIDLSNVTENIGSKNNTQATGILHSLLLIPPYPTFNWNKKTQDTILSSFFWGYMFLQVPAGQLAHYFGARYMLTSALMINGLSSFLLPWATFYGGWILTVIFRIAQGLSQGCIVPSMHTLFGKWAPLEERGRLAGFAYGGQALGTVLGLPITGFIAASSLGWPGVFRFYGLLSMLVGGIFCWYGADSPAKHRSISYEERTYIEEQLEQTNVGKKIPPVPWKKILKCRGLYAIVVAHIGNTWGQLTLYNEVPAFMDKVMGVNIKANGLLTALPFFVMWFTNFFFTWFTDMLIVKKVFSVTNTRKFANSLGSVSAAIGLVSLAFVPKDIYYVESLLVIICAFKIACHAGFQVNHIDISSNYSGTMMSISNFIANLIGSQAPMVAGFILTDVTSEYLWQQVFNVAAVFFFFSNLVYVIFGTAEKAEWDRILVKDTELSLEETEAMIASTKGEDKRRPQ